MFGGGSGARETVELKRACDAVAIPYGNRISLPQGSRVTILQSLGGDYTVMSDLGMMRIAGKDADALGKEVPPGAAEPPPDPPTSEWVEKRVWEELRTCYDPEIPVNIVDLGLVYRCEISKVPDPFQGRSVEVVMTLTAPGCGMGDVLKQDVERKLRALPGIDDVNVQLVFDPPWDQSRMSEAARLQLGLF